MTSGPAADAAAIPPDLVAAAAQRWRSARDAGRPAQPSLHPLLAARGYDMLAPLFDSLMTLGEACLGRQLCADCPFAEGDAALLSALLADPSALARLRCPRGGGCAAAFASALASARVMAGLAGEGAAVPERAAARPG